MKNFKFSKGLTLIEVLVGAALTLIIFLGIFGVYQLGLRIIGQSKARITATAVANEEMEKVRNLSYEDIGIKDGYPGGDIEETRTVTRNNIDYTITWDMEYIDDPLDGSDEEDLCPEECEKPSGAACPNDYKKARVKVSWAGRLGGEVALDTIIAPRDIYQECGEIGGVLLVSVFDSKGGMVFKPDILVQKLEDGGFGLTKTATPDSGEKKFLLPEGTYKITVTKEGYSRDETFGSGDVYDGQTIANPEHGHAIVSEGRFVEESFLIDKVGKFKIWTLEAKIDRIYYVRKTGSDDNDGLSPNKAFLTVQKAADVMIKGDIVFVGAGTYEEKVTIKNSGVDGKLIIFVADINGSYTGDAGEVIIKGTEEADCGFYIEGKKYIKIYGFKITNASNSAILITGSSSGNIELTNNDISGNTGDGIRIENGSDNTLSHNTIYSNEGRGIHLSGANKNNLVKNTVYENSLDGIRVEGSNFVSLNFNSSYSNGANGILVFNTSQNCTVTDNVTYLNTHDGIQIFDHAASIEVVGNKSYSNQGFGISFKEHITNANKIISNLAYDNAKSGISLSNSCVNTTISNNTSYKNQEYGVLIEVGSGNNEIRDNIIVNNTLAGIKVSASSPISSSYNDVQGNSPDYDGISAGDGCICENPLFVDPDGEDNILGGEKGEDDSFHLSQISSGQTQTSPCVNTGSDLASALGMDDKTTRTDDEPDTDKVDMGCHYRYSSEPPPSLPEVPDPFGNPIGNVSFHLLLKFQAGEEVIVGTDAAEQPIYKFSKNYQTDSNGYLEISNLEWGSYLFSDFSSGLLDLIVSYPSYPLVNLSPDTEQEVKLGLRAEDTLLMTVKDKVTGKPVFSASVRLYNTDLGYNETKHTDERGQVYFIPLDKAQYDFEIKAAGYIDLADKIYVVGHKEETRELERP